MSHVGQKSRALRAKKTICHINFYNFAKRNAVLNRFFPRAAASCAH